MLSLVLALLPAWQGSAASEGELTGGTIYSLPQWFKSSFLVFEEEVEEARRQGKHVMAFMHLDECPYCARMLDENFTSGASRDFMEEYFDVIGINVRGDLDVTWVDGVVYTERELAEHLNAFATPTVVFLDLDGHRVLQLNGYRDPRAFRYALDYVQSRRYVDTTFTDYLAEQEKPVVYDFRTHPKFEQATYFKGYGKPLALLFEDRHCAECARFHDRTLNHPDVLSALKEFLFVRLDTDSKQQVVDLEGRLTTPGRWADQLGLTFRPALVLFNYGKEMYRADGVLYHQHLSEALTYVEKGHLQHGALDEFKTAHREALMKSGRNIDFSE